MSGGQLEKFQQNRQNEKSQLNVVYAQYRENLIRAWPPFYRAGYRENLPKHLIFQIRCLTCNISSNSVALISFKTSKCALLIKSFIQPRFHAGIKRVSKLSKKTHFKVLSRDGIFWDFWYIVNMFLHLKQLEFFLLQLVLGLPIYSHKMTGLQILRTRWRFVCEWRWAEFKSA